MQTDDVAARFAKAGFSDWSAGEYPPHHTESDHALDFHVRVLVTSGDVTLTSNGVAATYRTGDEFTVDAGRIHHEAVGPQGLGIIVGIRPA
jgi:quercetin dioxygenase-like cupin family protein